MCVRTAIVRNCLWMDDKTRNQLCTLTQQLITICAVAWARDEKHCCETVSAHTPRSFISPLVMVRVAAAACMLSRAVKTSLSLATQVLPGEFPGVPRPAERHSPASVSWSSPGVFAQWDVPGRVPGAVYQEASLPGASSLALWHKLDPGR